MTGTCRYCGCSEAAPCDGGCTWTDASRTLCTTCRGAETIAESVVQVLGQVVASAHIRPMRTLVTWDDLTAQQKQLLVMSCRGTVDAVSEALLEGMTEDAVMAGVELNAIAGFLVEKCPAELREDEPVSQLVMRLLEPHLGARIVLPDGVRL